MESDLNSSKMVERLRVLYYEKKTLSILTHRQNNKVYKNSIQYLIIICYFKRICS